MALARSQIPMFFDSYNIDTHDIWGPNSGSIVSERERVTEARERDKRNNKRDMFLSHMFVCERID